jgi:hypothetical protein
MKKQIDHNSILNILHCSVKYVLNRLSLRIFVGALTCALLLTCPAGLVVANDKDIPAPKKGLEKGLEQAQEPTTPQAQCPKGMVWSAKDDQCISELKTIKESGGTTIPAGKAPHSQAQTPSDK